MKIKKTILALGPRGSNGHEAALQAQLIIDPNADWNIIFCEKNSDVLARAIKCEGMYAVVPFENKTGGPVKTIADHLFETCQRDSKSGIVGELPLLVNHCLLARPGWEKKPYSKILSHPQAFIQCSRFLSKAEWSQFERIEQPSTSSAAQLVSMDPAHADSLAIASVFAAKEYGLDNIFSGIQDVADNVTKFAILAPIAESWLTKSSLQEVTVTIVGGKGAYGKWFVSFFERNGCKVCSVDVDTPLAEVQSAISNTDVVMFSLPTLEAPDIIESLVPFSNEGDLWLDVTSLKVDVIRAMMLSSAEVVGLHPLCAPPRIDTLKGQALAVCAERLSKWGVWVTSLFSLLEADIDVITPEQHDYLVSERQGLPHAIMFLEAAVMRELGMDVAESFRVASPFYKLLLAAVSRMHIQNPKVYAGIQMGNNHMPKVLATLKNKVDQLCKMVETKDTKGFIEEFNLQAKHIGTETLVKGNEDFEGMIKFLADQRKKVK